MATSVTRRPAQAPTDFRAIGLQLLAVGFVLLLVLLVVGTALSNLEARGIPMGLDFLGARAGFTLSESLLPYEPDDSNLWAIIVGVGNTLFVSAMAILISTVAGTLLGIARLSENPLVSVLARTWIETARNTPLLLLLLFVYTIWWTLPANTGVNIGPGVFASMRGVVIPWVHLPWSAEILALSGLVAAAALVLAQRAGARVQALQGRKPRYVPAAALAILLVFVTGAAAGGATMDWPASDGGRITGGLTLTPEMATILAGLIFYTTGFIAEIVRSGITSVPRGQWEAARALGLSRPRILRLIIIPQMMRVIVPPMTSQYINVVKNSTLALAVGYSDFMVVMGTVINKTSRAIEGTGVIILVYLAINLSLSAVMNVYNRRVAIKER